MSRRVVLTGASSFVGLHLGLTFAAAGWDVTAVHTRSLEAYDALRAARLSHLSGVGRLIQADLAAPEAVAQIVETEQPALWLQHAGFAENYGSPDYDLVAAHKINVEALEPLYRALEGRGCGVIVTGSSMEYSASDLGNREDEPCWPDTPYGLSKLAETLRARQLAKRHGVPTRVARLYIPFGTFDNPRKLLSTVLSELKAGRALDLSAGEQRRDFCAIDDICKGYLALAADLERSLFDVFNLCGGEPIRLRDLLRELAGAIGVDASLLRFGTLPMRSGEPPVSYGDNAKAAQLLGWSPRPLAEAVKTLLGDDKVS
jgi:nucleoside-diphosphate-sugar epimerase